MQIRVKASRDLRGWIGLIIGLIKTVERAGKVSLRIDRTLELAQIAIEKVIQGGAGNSTSRRKRCNGGLVCPERAVVALVIIRTAVPEGVTALRPGQILIELQEILR